MHFWQNLERTTTNFPTLWWIVGSFLGVLLALYLFLPVERRRLRVTACVFAVGALGLCAAAGWLTCTGHAGAIYYTTRGCALFLVAVTFINILSELLFAAALKRIGLAPPRIVQDLIVGVAYIIVGIVLLSSSGLDIRGVVATSAIISAVVAFSLQDTLGNIMGGLALQLERTVRPGDWIRVDDIEGRVKEIRWRQTSLETRDWDTVVVPNSYLMKGRVILLGQRTDEPLQRRQTVEFNVDFRFPPTDIISVVEKALLAETSPLIASTPAPRCILYNFRESYATYVARYWLTDMALNDPTDSMVRARIFSALRRAGIPLSMPAQAVFLTEDDETYRDRKQHQQAERQLAALRGLSLFESLTDAELQTLATNLRATPFGRGEVMARQGAVAHSLYIIAEGEASVHVTIGTTTRKLGTLKAGEFFGEMGLLTGAPRAASVIAETDMECFRMGRSGLEEVLQSRPEVAEHMSRTLAQRRSELEKVKEEVAHEAQRTRAEHSESALLERIRDFFGLGHDQKPK